MKGQISNTKELAGYFIGGLVGGFVFGILKTHSITIALLYGLIAAICLALASASIYNLQNKILRSLTFGVVLGVSLSCLSYYLLHPVNGFFHYTVPMTIGCIAGGSLFIYLFSLRSQN
jgi:hypothetical protein